MGVERRETMSQQQGPRIPRVPQIFSGIESNKKMEKFKVNMVRTFVQQSNKHIDEFYKTVVDVAEEARRCYVEDGSVELDDMTEFTKMMFLDGFFVIQFMHCLLYDHENLKMTSHVAALVARDILLLENQLPFLVLRPLMNFIC
uniref:Uncharacterized protein n=1 Tax=Salix viminalis TaxID=40686 RepID=A0A6N2N881_SALVM